jgi:hypothetical protein
LFGFRQGSRAFGADLFGHFQLGAQTEFAQHRFELTDSVGKSHHSLLISGRQRLFQFGLGAVEILLDLGRFLADLGRDLAGGFAHFLRNGWSLLRNSCTPRAAPTRTAHRTTRGPARSAASHGRLSHSGQRQKNHRRDKHDASQPSCIHFRPPPVLVFHYKLPKGGEQEEGPINGAGFCPSLPRSPMRKKTRVRNGSIVYGFLSPCPVFGRDCAMVCV